MTQYAFDFVPSINRNIQYGSGGIVSVFPSLGNLAGFFVRYRRTGELLVPVGNELCINTSNHTTWMAAFPARLRTAQGNWKNTFAGCEITNMSTMPATGMAEARPNEISEVNAWRLPSGRKLAFIVADGVVRYNHSSFDCIEIGYRFPVDPGKFHGTSSELTARQAGSEGMSDKREATGLSYHTEALSFGMLKLVSRAALAPHLVADTGQEFDPTVDQHWSSGRLHKTGLDTRIQKIVLDTARY